MLCSFRHACLCSFLAFAPLSSARCPPHAYCHSMLLQVQAGDGLLCKRATGPDLGKACKESCASACTDALARYEARMFAETGFKLEPKERERVLRNCRHSCSYECTKSGKAHDFVVPYRR
jgi:hypothetical protein